MLDIRTKLAELKISDKNLDVFGASSHEYKLNSPLPEEQLTAIEAKYECCFPDEYRDFITSIGNGGAGPCYGLFPIEMEDDNHDMCSWEEGYLVGDLSKPFLYTADWNLPESFWENEPDADKCDSEEEEALLEAWEEQLSQQYWSSKVMDGAIPICHEGCAIRIWLVITGPMKGTIWRDLRADYKGLILLKDEESNPLSFNSWYVNWLNNSLERLR